MVSVPEPKPKTAKSKPAKNEKQIALRLRGDDLRIFRELRAYYENEEQQEVILLGIRFLHDAIVEKKLKDKKTK